jgi:AbiV family abortive infection protein
MVTPEYLLKGAAYALEQCGLLLRDANLLYRSGSYASAVALAAFAREELGRWKLLLDLRKEVIRGNSLTVKEIQARCNDHLRKQKAGMLSIVMRNAGLGPLLQTYSANPGSVEWNTAHEEIEKLRRKKAKHVPEDRHKQRVAALYVDAVSLDRWNRPTKEISQALAHKFLRDTVNDYSSAYDRYTDLETYKPGDPKEPLINLRIVAHCAFDSRATVWTGS